MAASLTLTVARAAQSPAPPPVQLSTVLDWNAVPPAPTDVGSVRQSLRARTPTLDELEIHVTTLRARQETGALFLGVEAPARQGARSAHTGCM